jgi:hypothetical protein
MSAIGSNGTHLEVGAGALFSTTLIPSLARNPLDAPVTGPNANFVQLRDGAPANALQQIADELSTASDRGVNVVAVQRPAEIINYRFLGTTPGLTRWCLGHRHRVGLPVAIGVVVGVPVSIVFGRWLWDLFAHNIDVAPSPTVPTVSIVLIAAGALVLANIVAAVRGFVAAQTKWRPYCEPHSDLPRLHLDLT